MPGSFAVLAIIPLILSETPVGLASTVQNSVF